MRGFPGAIVVVPVVFVVVVPVMLGAIVVVPVVPVVVVPVVVVLGAIVVVPVVPVVVVPVVLGSVCVCGQPIPPSRGSDRSIARKNDYPGARDKDLAEYFKPSPCFINFFFNLYAHFECSFQS